MTWGEGGSKQKMTKCDMGGGGSKIAIFGVTYFLHGPLFVNTKISTNRVLKKYNFTLFMNSELRLLQLFLSGRGNGGRGSGSF